MKVYIYGSCVSRDAFEFEGAPTLVDYRARSTVGSAFGPPVDVKQVSGIDFGDNTSRFQGRMVKADIEKTLPRDLLRSTFDLLLVDFIDERFSVVRVGDGVVTRSTDALKCGLQSYPMDRIHFGSDEHMELFRAGWKRLLQTVPASKIVINRVYWAEFDSEGEPVEDALKVSQSNDVLSRLYEIAGASPEIRFIDYPASAFTADPSHKWGRSPFHYVPDLYDMTLKALQEFSKTIAI